MLSFKHIKTRTPERLPTTQILAEHELPTEQYLFYFPGQIDALLRMLSLGCKMICFEGFMTILKEAVQEKPDVLICTLTFPELMDEILLPAIADGLPVIGINAADMRPEEDQIPVSTYIGEDSYLIGVTAAEETLKRFTPKRAMFANHQFGSVNVDARGQGWVDAMEKHGIPAEQLNITGDDMGKAAQFVAAYLLTHPDTDGIFLCNIPVPKQLSPDWKRMNIRPEKISNSL